MNEPTLRTGDIVFTRGWGFLSRAIRVLTRLPHERATVANHVALVVEGGAVEDSMIVEAVSRVVRRTIGEAYGGKRTAFCVYRSKQLNEHDRMRAAIAACRLVGQGYGWAKLPLFAADWALSWAVQPLHWLMRKITTNVSQESVDVYLFRALGRIDRLPFCSRLVAGIWKQVFDWDFGVPWRGASPDDMLDYVEAHPENYELVRGWSKLRP